MCLYIRYLNCYWQIYALYYILYYAHYIILRLKDLNRDFLKISLYLYDNTFLLKFKSFFEFIIK